MHLSITEALKRRYRNFSEQNGRSLGSDRSSIKLTAVLWQVLNEAHLADTGTRASDEDGLSK